MSKMFREPEKEGEGCPNLTQIYIAHEDQESKEMKQIDEPKIRPMLRLSEIDRLIRRHRIIVPPLDRRTLRAMCEDGTFDTANIGRERLGWLVYEDSFWEWAKGFGKAGGE